MTEQFRKIFSSHTEMSVRYDRNQEAIWGYFKPSARPCFSPTILKEAKRFLKDIIRYFEAGVDEENYPVKYVILASQTPGVFNLGADLDLYIDLIMQQNRDTLLEYATDCVDICHMFDTSLDLPVTTISYVEGLALGGGFELAMSGNVFIAEKHSQMGLPEIRFNLFPGMGAYNFLSRKVGIVKAEEIIVNGKIHSGPDLHKLGVVDILAESGKGYEAIDCFIRKHRKFSNGMRAIQKVRQINHPVSREELMEITRAWVDTALKLKREDLKSMARYVISQNQRRMGTEHRPDTYQVVRSRQDRRIDTTSRKVPFVDNDGNCILNDRRGNVDRRSSSIMRMSV